MRNLNNFQQEFTLEDIEIAKDITGTYDCGMSRIALKAPEQRSLIHRGIMKEPDSASALVCQKTLKLQYAIQVWNKAALISANNPSNLLYYWWLHWEEGEGAFNELVYSDFHKDITVEQLLLQFWDLLKEIADSGEIKVTEGYNIRNEGVGNSGPKIVCDIVIDTDIARDINVDDVYKYPYNHEPKSYSWDEVKGMFCELTLNQLRLTMPHKLHRRSKKDDILLKACTDWDIDQIKLSLKNGANVNCLDEHGESTLQKAVEYYKDHDMFFNVDYTKEEKEAIEARNEINGMQQNLIQPGVTDETAYDECVVYYESWQIQCCGEPFAIGDKVEWTCITPKEYKNAHGIIVDFEEEHHGFATHSITGIVKRIIVERSEFPKGQRETWYDKANCIHEDLSSVDGWESERKSNETTEYTFWGYIVELTKVSVKPITGDCNNEARTI